MRFAPATSALALFALALPSLAQGSMPEPAPEPKPPLSEDDVLKVLRDSLPFDVGGSFFLWHYHPFIDGADDLTEIYYASLTFDAHYDDFGIHFEPRFRDTKLRPFFESNFWIQELYMSWKPDADS